MTTVEDALRLLAEALGPPGVRPESVSLADAAGRVLTEDVRMDHDVPPFRRAAMDGYAVRGEDAPVGAVLRVVGRVAAGEVPSVSVGQGQAVRIMTGAPVPPGADVVLPHEWTEPEADRVAVRERPRDAAHIVERAEHVAEGDVVVASGRWITPAVVGALAAAGRARVRVAVPPSVAVLGTGSELVDAAERPGPGRIRNSNGPCLVAQAERAGARPTALGLARDDEDELAAAVRRGLQADILVLSGGVSMGDLDLVPSVLEAAGVRCVFHRWAVQPGGPLWFGVRDRTLVFGLPGNPAASFVGFEVLVVPAVAARLGRPFAPRRTLRAVYRGAWGRALDRRRYRPVVLASRDDGTLVAEAVPWKGSGDPFGLAAAEGLAVLEEGRAEPQEEDRAVDVILLGSPA